MKIIISMFFILSSFTVSYAQPPVTYFNPHYNSENLNDANNMLVRYWYYRWRLQNDFLIVGDKPGYSIPAEDREQAESGGLRWGDGTIWLGQYIIMLTTENALLRYSNRYYDLLKNERELYYAMQAFNRLDEQGDTYYDAGTSHGGSNTPLPPCKNGFFLRDDVPARFFTTNYKESAFNINDINTWNTTIEYNHFTNGKSGFNYFYKPNIAISSGGLCKIDNSSNPDYTNPYTLMTHDSKAQMDYDNGDGSNTFAMSQDQISRLLAGFVSVIRAMPTGTTMVDTDEDGYGDTPFNFAEEAKIHCTNIIARGYGMSSNTHDNQIPASCNLLYPGVTWFIQDPLGEAPGIGNWTGSIAPMLSKAWKDNYSDNHTIPGLSQAYVSFVHMGTTSPISANLIVSGAGEVTSQNQQSNSKNYLYAEIASGIYPVWNLTTIMAFVVSNKNSVLNHIYNYSKNNHPNQPEKTFFWHTYMVPLYCYLHNVTPSSNNAISNWIQTRSDMLIQLISAPCSGPYNYLKVGSTSPTDKFQSNYPSMPAMGNNGWNTTFRFDQPQYRSTHGFVYNDQGEQIIDHGFFNGIDYMSEMNLYYITSNTLINMMTALPFYQNLIDRYVDYPVSSDNTPMLGAFNTLTLTKEVSGSAPLDIQAGSSIHLQDGTHISASQPSKHLFIKTFSCSDFNSGGYELPQVQDSTLQVERTLRPMNNDYGFNEVFSLKKYDYANMGNVATAEEITQNMEDYSIEEYNTSDSIVLYPNPTKNFFSIKNIETQKIASCTVQLMSLEGKIVPIEQTREIYDISLLAPGTYVAHLQFPSGAVSTKKLIVLP